MRKIKYLIAVVVSLLIAAGEHTSASTNDIQRLDSLFWSIVEAKDNENWDQVTVLSQRALAMPKSLLEEYPMTYAIYECYAFALNSLWRYTSVPNLVKDGLKYEEKTFEPTSKEYYNLRIMEIAALLMMNDCDTASERLEEIDIISRKMGHNIMAEEVATLYLMINEFKESLDWRKEADAHVDRIYRIAESLLLKPKDTAEGYEMWTGFFHTVMSELQQYYFDINSLYDERYWSRVMACLIVYFATSCDDLPNRECLAYDIALLRKNFLDYHTGALHKKPCTWENIRDMLSPEEIAVEITMCPNEILILGKSFEKPVSVQIPQEIMLKLGEYNSKDAVIVNETYYTDGVIEQLLNLISQYLVGIKQIYISPSNIFAQFNYRAAPFQGKRFDEIYNVIQMTSTADIDFQKQHKVISGTHKAVLFGGANFDADIDNISPESKTSEITPLIAEMRRGYGYLPYSLKEVEQIALILGNENCALFTGDSADKESFLKLDGTSASIIHVATHGYTIPSTHLLNQEEDLSKIASVMARTGLLLAGANNSLKKEDSSSTGILTSGEIAKLDLNNVELAVLSFCSSGLGDITNTTGVVYGVANAMKSSGVKHVLVCLWDIPDEVASIAMASFYQSLSRGSNSYKALSDMRVCLIGKGYFEPYYWAPFVILD